jgi:peptidoglycan/LPS O-acetylase OafA/YrhL
MRGGSDKGSRRLVWLDAARGVAILSVVYHHYAAGLRVGFVTLPDRPLFGLLDMGRFGVVLFFAISGYIITQSLAKDDEEQAPIWRFVIHRLFRLYPAYWASICVALLLAHHPLGEVAWNVTMLQQFVGTPNVVFVYWTLQIELVFYLLCAAIYVAGLIRHRDAPYLLCRSALALALVLAAGRYATGIRLPVAMPLGLSVMFLGFAWRREGSSRRFWKLLALFEAVLLPTCLLAYTTTATGDEHWSWYFVSNTAGVLVFLALSRCRIMWRPIVFCGEVSYSMYLLHLPILQLLVGEHAESAPANVAVAALVMSAASYASYRLFEQPFIAVGRRVAERLVKLRIPTLVA